MTPTERPFSERLAEAERVVDYLLCEAITERPHPPWVADQARAATAELVDRIDETTTGDNWQQLDGHTLNELGRQRVVYCVAAAMDAKRCPHITNGGTQPVYVDLDHGLARCGRCAQTHRNPTEDRRCHVCGEPVDDGDVLIAFCMQISYLAIDGAVGPCCAPFVVPEVGAA